MGFFQNKSRQSPVDDPFAILQFISGFTFLSNSQNRKNHDYHHHTLRVRRDRSHLLLFHDRDIQPSRYPQEPYLGLVNGDILSQSLFAGWAPNGVPWERAPILALLTLAALLVPMATGKAFYCHQLCPHGAAQQWMGKLRKSSFRLPVKLGKLLETIPFALLLFVVFLAFAGSAHTAAILEPFDAYVWEVAGGVTLAIALISLVASAPLKRLKLLHL